MEKILDVRELSKNFGAKKAVDRISLSVTKGEVMGLLGPNGAGKTGNPMMMGILAPMAGRLALFQRLPPKA